MGAAISHEENNSSAYGAVRGVVGWVKLRELLEESNAPHRASAEKECFTMAQKNPLDAPRKPRDYCPTESRVVWDPSSPPGT